MQDSPDKGCVIKLKVSPKASRNAIAGWYGDQLKVSVTAAPERGRANAGVIVLLAKQLGIAKSRCRVLRGHTGRDKVLHIDLPCAQVYQQLGEPDAAS